MSNENASNYRNCDLRVGRLLSVRPSQSDQGADQARADAQSPQMACMGQEKEQKRLIRLSAAQRQLNNEG